MRLVRIVPTPSPPQEERRPYVSKLLCCRVRTLAWPWGQAVAFVICAISVGGCRLTPHQSTDTSAAPRVFLLDGNHLHSIKARLQAGDKTLAEPIARLESQAHEALASK